MVLPISIYMYYIKDAKNNIDIDFYSIRFLWHEIEHIFFSLRKREIRPNYYNQLLIQPIFIPYVTRLSFRKKNPMKFNTACAYRK